MSALKVLIGGGLGGDDAPESMDSPDVDSVKKSMARRVRMALKGDDDAALADAMEKFMACCDPDMGSEEEESGSDKESEKGY